MRLALTVILALGLSCAAGQPASETTALSPQDAVREAVLRYMFRPLLPLTRPQGPYSIPVRVFFVGGYTDIQGRGVTTDFSDALMQRFRSDKPVVRRISRVVPYRQQFPDRGPGSTIERDGWKDKFTGAEGIVFYIIDIKRLNKNSATVDAEVRPASMLSATEADYDLAFDGSRWKVTREYNINSN